MGRHGYNRSLLHSRAAYIIARLPLEFLVRLYEETFAMMEGLSEHLQRLRTEKHEWQQKMTELRREQLQWHGRSCHPRPRRRAKFSISSSAALALAMGAGRATRTLVARATARL